ncbi:MAG: hypothetical protein AB1Z98_14245 [Nannocystaceae bacterium]
MTPIIPSTIALCLSLAVAPVAPGSGETADRSEDALFYPVRIVVDVTELKKEQPAEDADATQRRIIDELGDKLRQGYHLQVVDDEGVEVDAAQLIIELSWTNYADADYWVSVRVQRPDGHEEPPIEYECVDCFDAELVDQTYARASEFVALVQRPSPVEVIEPSDDGSEPPETEPAPRRRGMRIAGYTAIGVGTLALVGGVVAMTRPPTPADDQTLTYKDFQPLGVGLVVGGSVALATGIALVVTDVVRCRRKGSCTQTPEPAKAAVHPWISPTTAGIGLLRHF